MGELLADQPRDVRLMTRTPDAVAGIGADSIVEADYTAPDSLTVAFDGVDVAFIVSGYAEPGRRARQHKNAIDAAIQAGTEHLVYLSFQGASPDSHFPMSRDHYRTEQFLRESGIPFTALRDNLYLDLAPEMFGSDSVLRGPADDGAVAWVSREDVARTVVAALTEPTAHEGTFDVTGPEAMTLTETVERLSALVDRELEYQNETVDEGRAWRREYDVPEWEVDVWIGSYRAIAAGELEETSDTVRRFAGREPYPLEEYFSERPSLLAPLQSEE